MSFLQQLLTLPTVQDAKLSPDGRWVAFSWYRVHENCDIFLAPASGEVEPIALTHSREWSNLISWTPDSRSVVFSEDHDRDERYRLYRVDIENPGEATPLTEGNPPFFLRGGDISPDGENLYYGANYDFTTNRPIEPSWIYRHNLRTGERKPLACPDKPVFTIPELNLQGTHLIYARKDKHPSGRQYSLVDIAAESDQEILNFGDQAKVFARWFPDGERILVLAEALPASATGTSSHPYNRVGVYHVHSGSTDWLVDDPQRAIEGAWVSRDGTIIIDEVLQATHRPTFIDPKSGLEQAFPSVQGNLVPLGRAADGTWIAKHYASVSPPDLVRFFFDEERSGAKAELSSLTNLWAQTDLEPNDLVPAESTHWNSRDGLEIQGWLYRAQPNPERSVIFVHGGPTHHSEDRLNPEIQYLVSRRFNVLDVNYRGSTGFGLAFREAIKEDGWGGREQEDIASAAQALIARGLAASGKVGITGTSYGGYSSWFQITHFPREMIAASAPICGMTDLVVDYQTTRPDLRPYSEEMLGGSPKQAPERYYERSPINFVQHIQGRLLIVQGAVDPNVTPENVRQVVERLEANNIPFELLVFEDEGHGVYKRANQEVLYTRLADFFEAALA